MTGITLRVAGKECAETLAAIHQECFLTYWDIEAFSGFFSVHNTHALLAEREGEKAGMAVFRLTPDEAEIITLAVRPDFRRRGVGRALLEKTMKEAASTGLKVMFLDVEAGNEAAVKLYESQGFAQINRRRQYYRQKDGSYTDALVMRLVLGN